MSILLNKLVPQINLLKQKSASQSFLESAPSILAKLLMVAILGLVGLYVWYFIQSKSLTKEILADQQSASAIAQQAGNIANKEEIYTRQAQLNELNTLIEKHLYWSAVFPALAKVTLRGASYNSLSVTKEGLLTLSVTVPDLSAVDKFLQVFDQPEFYKDFHNLKIGAFRRVTDSTGESYKFEVQMEFNRDLLKYQPESKTTTSN